MPLLAGLGNFPIIVGAPAAPTVVPNLLRVVTTNNRLSTAGFSGTKGRLVTSSTNTAFASQTLHVLSTPATEYRLMVMGAWYVTNTGEANLPNTYTIEKLAISDNTTQTPVTFNGSRSLVVGYNDYYMSDPFTLSAAAGIRLKIKSQGFVTTSGDSLPQAVPAWTNASDTNAYNARFYTFDPAVGTVDIDVNPGYVVKPSGATAQKYSLPLILVGNPIAPSVSLGIFGDSLTFGYNEDIIVGVSAYTQPNLGMGPYSRGTAATDGISNSIPSIISGVHSEFGTNFMNAGDRRKSILPFVNGVHVAYGTNDLGTNGTGTVSGIQSMLATIAGQVRAVPNISKVWVSNLQPQTTSTDNFATTANQTPKTGWEAGGKRDQINAWLATQNGSTFNGVADVATAVSDTTRPEVWKATGTARQWTDEGQHWGNNSQTAFSQSAIAAQLRALWV